MKEYLPVDWEANRSIIKVIGVGGGGGNAVNQMFRQGIKDVDFLICNTDVQALAASPVPEKLQLGNVATRGLGAGCNPEQGRKAAMETIDKITELLSGYTEMVFITAGMGGGTGTGAAPVIAKVARDMGLLTVAVVTLPFRDEGSEFLKRAILGIKELEKNVDSLLIIDNQKLYKIFGELSIFEAFPKADAVLSTAVKGIAEIITRPGFINVDFADVRMVMNNSGMALMGVGTATGENRAIRAVEEALSSPLLNDFDLTSAKNVLVNITSSNDHGLTMAELSQIMAYISEFTGGNAENFKRGVVCDPSIGESISVTIVATGFDMHSLPQISSSGGKIVESVVLGNEIMQSVSQKNEEHLSPVPADIIPAERPLKPSVKQPSYSQESVVKKSKPALILEQGEDISQLEKQPAYIRKQMKLKNQESGSPVSDMRESSTFRLEENDGKQQLLSDNSYIHQTQD
ncbi:MAG: cell division protein FtsZ [Bacteroidetes bacterium GWE2_39_28]|nr:MAG: cell division protein FtsZ [Bacteroidetes bacterium GWE2_39_28]OFY11676.1 MAG: cell division protein FtsZ [Bacteroidetes bacterium GWF2_39_10]OFZ06661.1 MAG: cell division protein FtsZ [Bacteroidetes bacterium RIFOXYB2_FULL_39_7]OFZ11543.1 MAG: cell division protein FtsZ [Bacteroidetes bacterium RIFOXYC2_FULL_39_11]HCT94723.1 cell division protein FtsZ [Rikenellaceae bacterium]